MGLTLKELKIIDVESVWIALSLEDEKTELKESDYADETAYYNAFVNNLCLKVVATWLTEYLEIDEQKITIFPTQKDAQKLWNFIDGTAIEVENTRFIIVPVESVNIQECSIQKEWIDLQNWIGNYYLFVEINLDKHWLRILGYTTHKTIKSKGKYDCTTRTYSLAREQLIDDLEVMWIARELCPDETEKVEQLPVITRSKALDLASEVQNYLSSVARLSLDFEHWGALLENHWDLLSIKIPVSTINQSLSPLKNIVDISEDIMINLKSWWQRQFPKNWYPIYELLGSNESNFTFAFRGKAGSRESIPEDRKTIPALIQLLDDKDEETRLKAAECLGRIAPNNAEAITALIDLFNTSFDKWTRHQAIDSLERIGKGNKQASSALSQLLKTLEEDEFRWKVALALGKIDPEHPEGGVSRAKQIDLGMELAGHSVALLVAQMPKTEQETDILVRVRPMQEHLYLPSGLQLMIFDQFGEKVDDVHARDADNLIQLPFCVEPPERFSITVELGKVSHTEQFTSG
ncbi:DUF1822 family protein [Okeania sp. SIO2B3]|uniref:DUF1822 family protein n=1 Tax=Okeania sp. SIO2B3 TaxID=2607784 RepID=UPI0013BF4B11|nr:DUF1822 family protein [Okeania sp. SIO2B3]NET45433.1 DUF1822 family protein [Okeania sp. SIO2B3]